jgi:hypothetical protein
MCFIQNGGRLARDANGGPAGWINFEIESSPQNVHKEPNSSSCVGFGGANLDSNWGITIFCIVY